MPVRINLKELLGSDSQNITIDKLNFNFNKLLELGIGLKGDKGSAGPQGSVGPAGLQGEQGERGSLWFVGSGTPISSPDLQDNDCYIDTIENIFWQYDKDTDVWTSFLDLKQLINSQIIVQGGTFVRGLGETSPQDSRFIVFTNRGNTDPDRAGDTPGSGSTDNDILFLCNFNESLPTIWPDLEFNIETKTLFNSIQAIYVDKTNPFNRSHLELGSLFTDSKNKYGHGVTKEVLSESDINVKFRHEVIPSYLHPILGKSYLNKGILSLSPINEADVNSISDNTLFEINTIKNNPSELPSISYFRLGSAAGFYDNDEGVSNEIISGINGLELEIDAIKLRMGLKYIDDPHYFSEAKQLYVIASTSDGLMINNDVYQDRGSIEQLGTKLTQLTKVNAAVAAESIPLQSNTVGTNGIASIGNILFTTQGMAIISEGEVIKDLSNTTRSGAIHAISINNPDAPVALHSKTFNGYTGDDYDPIYSNNYISGVALCDIQMINSDHFLVLNNQYYNSSASGYNETDSFNEYAYMQICKYSKRGTSSMPFWLVSRMGYSYYDPYYPPANTETFPGSGELEAAWRSLVIGSNVIVATNRIRYWGSNNLTSSCMFNDVGKLSIVNITNVHSPYVTYTATSAGHNYIDIAKTDSGFLTLSIKLNTADSTTFDKYQLAVSHGMIDEDNTLSQTVFNFFATFNNNIDKNNYRQLNKLNPFGAIDASGSYAYVVHGQKLYIFKHDKSFSYPALITTLDYHSEGGYTRSYDCKVIGETLYILCSIGSDSDSYNIDGTTHVIKLNIKDALNVRKIGSVEDGLIDAKNASRFIVVGNKIYVADTDKTNNSILIPVNVDSIKSDHANIGAIKTTKLDVVDQAIIGGDALIGGGLSVSGPIHSGGGLTGPGSIPKYTVIPYANPNYATVFTGGLGNVGTDVQGWAICNGANGTPDLRGRFIVGVGQSSTYTPGSGDVNPTYAYGDDGGENKHKLITSEIPGHQHTQQGTFTSTGQSQSHTHSIPIHSGGSSTKTVDTNTGVDSPDTAHYPTGGASADHTHNVTLSGGTTSVGGDLTHENRPPYYALVYIMKIV